MPSLLERLDVTLTNLAVRRGRWLEAPHGPGRIRLAYTAALDATCRAAVAPVRFGVLADKLASAFSTAPAAASAMLGGNWCERVCSSATCVRHSPSPTRLATWSTSSTASASALLRLAREPDGGRMALLPSDVRGPLRHRHAGAGHRRNQRRWHRLPAQLSDSRLPDPVEPPSKRDQRLFALA